MRLLAVLLTLALPAFSQETKRVTLSPKSNLSTSQIAEGFNKYCPNVLVTENVEKADYKLETIQDEGSWHFTLLSKDGDILFTTHPQRSLMFTVFSIRSYAHHFEDTCKFINGPKWKKP